LKFRVRPGIVLGRMENLTADDLTIEATEAEPPEPLILVWRGKSDDRYPAKILGPYFSRVLSRAEERKVAVEMHFEKLDHFNSSTIAAVIRFIQDARQRGVKLVLVYNHQLKWQKLSFDALRVFAKDDQLELRALPQAAVNG
jgi:hypothetical protein